MIKFSLICCRQRELSSRDCAISRGRFDSIQRWRQWPSGGEYSSKYSPNIKYLYDLTTPGGDSV
jgi:hypothetical protein